MKKKNRNGFAIAGLIYALVIFMLLLVGTVVVVASSRASSLNTMVETIIETLDASRLSNYEPYITLNDSSYLYHELGEAYVEYGANAYDQEGNELTVVIDLGTLDVDVAGIYDVTYSAVDDDGIEASVIRQVEVANLANWMYRREITINYSKIDEDLTDFPITIMLSSSNFDFSKVQDNGEDLRFMDDDGNVLSYEIERFSLIEEEAVFHVKVPFISSNENTIMYIYYGNDNTYSTANAQDVWDDDYQLVLHMGASLLDSTSNNNDATNYGSTYVSDGQVGGARSFDGVDDYLLAPGTSVPVGDEITVSLYTKGGSNLPLDGTTVIEARAGNAAYGRLVNVHLPWSNEWVYADLGNNGGYDRIATGVSSAIYKDSWQYWSFTKDAVAGYMQIIANDTQLDYGTGKTKSFPAATTDLIIGNGYDEGDNDISTGKPWEGIISEVRISGIERSDAWIKAEYNSLNNTLISIDISEETLHNVDEDYIPFDNLVAYYNFNIYEEPTENLIVDATYHPDYQPFSVVNHSDVVGLTTEVAPPVDGMDVYRAYVDGTDTWPMRFAFRFDASTMNLYDETHTYSMYIYLPSEYEDRYALSDSYVYLNSSGTDWHGFTGYNSTYDTYGAGNIEISEEPADLTKVDTWQKISVTFYANSSDRYLDAGANNIWITGFLRVLVDDSTLNTAELPQHVYVTTPQLESKSYSTDFTLTTRDGVIDDLTPNENDITLTVAETPTHVSSDAIEYGAYYFDGIDDTMQTPDLGISNNEISIGLWIKPDLRSGYSDLIVPLSNGIDQRIYYSYDAQRIAFQVVDSADINERTYTYPSGSVPRDEWSHIFITCDGSKINLYLNGVLIDTIIDNDEIAAFSGAYTIGQRGNDTNYYQGFMDEVMVYNTVLSEETINFIYNQKKD